jgi:hypothetical protein
MKKARNGIPIFAAALAAWALAGCATISENTRAYLGSPQMAPSNPSNVQIFASEPARAKERLGEIMLSVEGNPPRAKVEEKLRKAAATLGADGVFVVSDQTHVSPWVYWDWCGPVTSEDWHRVIVGVAFKNK